MIDFIINLCGWIGALSYCLYTVPQALYVFQKGHTQGLSTGLVLLSFVGSLCSLVYILPDVTSPLFYNFLICFISTSVILKFHYLPRNTAE